MPSKQWKNIANNYKLERDKKSFMSMLLDKAFVSLVGTEKQSILDYGAGTGTMARLFNKLDHKVIAFEPMEEMFLALKESTPSSEFTNISTYQEKSNLMKNIKKVDTVVCVNVFDHILDIPKVLNEFNQFLNINGRLLLCIPHPIKNLGHWVKRKNGDKWDYQYYKLNDYLKECEVKRDREDVDGNLIISDVVSQHRTISTYYNWIVNAGFTVKSMAEPKPTKEDFINFPILSTQCSRIPYFWILDCVKSS